MYNSSQNLLHDVMRQMSAGEDRLLAALAYARAGASVLFVDPDSKAPLDLRTPQTRTKDRKLAVEAAQAAGDHNWHKVEGPGGRDLATTNEARLKRYWAAAQAQGITPNLGIHIEWSGLVVIDADTAAEVAAVQEMAVGFSEPRPPESYTVTTRSPGQRNDAGEWVHKDGGHFIYLQDVEGLDLVTEFKPERGGGAVVSMTDRYILVPPSVRPEGPYVNVGPVRRLSDEPWLVELLRAQAVENAVAATAREAAKTEREERREAGEDSLGVSITEWNDAHSWEDLLSEAGWEPNYSGKGGRRLSRQRMDRCGCPTWTAPGDHADGKSATAHDGLTCGSDRVDAEGGSMPLQVWTSSRPAGMDHYPLSRARWTKAQFVTDTKYAGDMGAFLRAEGISAEVADPSSFAFEPGDPFGITAHTTPDEPYPAPPTLSPDNPFAALALSAGNPFAEAAAREASAPAGPPSPRESPGEPPPEPLGDLSEDEEASFWASSDELKTIRQFAWSRLDSPWSTLGAVLCHVVARIPHTVVLPPTVGSVASLNTFVAVVGPPGAGKGNASAVAHELLTGITPVAGGELGSGEGLPKTYGERPRTSLHTTRVADRAIFEAAEVDTVVGQGSRQGSILLPQLRKLWSGESLGVRNSDKTKALHVPRHSYRAALIMGVQPIKARPILEGDSDGGLPQRFLWLPALDPSMPPPNTVTQPEPLDLSFIERRWPVDPMLVPFAPGPVDDDAEPLGEPLIMREPKLEELTVVEVAQSVKDELQANRWRRHQGEATDATLDGHAGLSRLKVAVALSVLEGGAGNVDVDHWERAGLIMRKSNATRDAISAAFREKDRKATTAKATEAAAVQIHVQTVAENDAMRKVLARIKALLAAGEMAERDLRARFDSAKRPLADECLEKMILAGMMHTREERVGGHVRRFFTLK